MNTILLQKINNGHSFGDPSNNFVLTLGQDTPDKAPNTKDYTSESKYYYDLVEYCKRYIESNGYGSVINSYDGKGTFYHLSIELNDETACMGGILINKYTANIKNNSLDFAAKSCTSSGCIPIVNDNNSISVATAVALSNIDESTIDWSQRSIVVTKADSAIYGLDRNGEMQYLDNVPAGTRLGYANGKDKGVLTVRTFAGVDVFINADLIQYQN